MISLNKMIFLNFFWASLRIRENFPPIFFSRYNKTPLVIVQQYLENSLISPYIFMCKIRVLDHTIHSFTCSLLKYQWVTTSGLCYTLGWHQQKWKAWSLKHWSPHTVREDLCHAQWQQIHISIVVNTIKKQCRVIWKHLTKKLDLLLERRIF